MKKHKTKASNIPMALAVSTAVSMSITLLAAASMTFLIAGETLQLESSDVAVLGILLLASLAGSWVAIKGAGEKPWLLGLLSGGLYYLLLLCCTALFFDGQYQGLGATALAVLGGSLGAVLFTMRKGSGKGKRRYRRK